MERGLAKGSFTRKVNVLRERFDADDPCTVLRGLYTEVEEAFKILEVKHECYFSMLLSDESESSAVSEAEAYILACERTKSELYSLITQKGTAQRNINDTAIKVRPPLDPPIFSGDTRSYGTFKKDYMRLIVPMYGRDAYALKKCLAGDALTCVEGVEDEFQEMFSRLDNKYGNPCKLTESIVSELKNLKPVQDGDSKRLVRLIKVVERAWLDMKKMGLESEMKTTWMVTLVERLLPHVLKRSWVLKVQTVDDSRDLFENLLDFLLTERRVCEYLDSDLRSNPTKLTTHSVVGEETSCENVQDALQEIKVIQGQQNAMITECLSTVAKLASGLPACRP